MAGARSLAALVTMDAPDKNKTIAWQPLTPRGVAAFASAALGRLFLVQLVVALLVAGVVVWFLHAAWFPSITAAIRQLPDQGRIRGGILEWPGPSPAVLAEGRFLAFSVDLEHLGNARSPAHLLVEFGRNDFKIFSLLGYVRNPYPQGRTVAFNRRELEPWWGAWSPMFLAMAGVAAAAGLMLTWAVLATLYSGPAWLVGFFANRDAGWRANWRLAGAALMPGAVFMAGALLAYGFGALDLVRLAFAGVVHLLIGWGYLAAGLFSLPRHSAAPKVAPNPFSPT
jgi:hypothetical protein